MKIHFIAIGGAVMHNLAMALQKEGHEVTGSDDEIFEPSKSRLEKYGLLPQEFGWHTERITDDIDAIILGMHAKEDNPELVKAKSLGLKIYSFPEFLYERTKNKKRFVVAGSHGKTTITSMVLHVLRTLDVAFDYMVGSQIEGFETMVGFSKDAKIAVFEGDEYLTSPLDLRPKFVHYHPTSVIITGIAWDHFNVYPTFDSYVDTFSKLIDLTSNKVFFDQTDEVLTEMAREHKYSDKCEGYDAVSYTPEGDFTQVAFEGKQYTLKTFGNHNMRNLQSAMLLSFEMGVDKHDFLNAMQSFSGAARRLELIAEKNGSKFYRDFAHSPSKVKATVAAAKEQFPDKTLKVVLELHTFSSLNPDFIPQYEGTLDPANESVLFYDEHVVEMKKLEKVSDDFLKASFQNNSIEVIRAKELLHKQVAGWFDSKDSIVLLLSSGSFAGLNLKEVVYK